MLGLIEVSRVDSDEQIVQRRLSGTQASLGGSDTLLGLVDVVRIRSIEQIRSFRFGRDQSCRCGDDGLFGLVGVFIGGGRQQIVEPGLGSLECRLSGGDRFGCLGEFFWVGFSSEVVQTGFPPPTGTTLLRRVS